jgi:signal peptidase I
MLNRIENPWLRGAAEWLISIGLAVLLFFVVRGFVFRTANVDGHSMAPTLEHGDMVILNRFAYVVSTPRAGDIVAFPNPENPDENFIKRVIAVPGDIVDFRDGFFYVNYERLNDEFSLEPTLVTSGFNFVVFPLIVEEEHYFVLGDNRNGSQDSRFASVGNIYAREMIGRATIRFWPFGRFGRVN